LGSKRKAEIELKRASGIHEVKVFMIPAERNEKDDLDCALLARKKMQHISRHLRRD
jgi:hypothetical protein